MAQFLIGFNTFVALVVIVLMQFYGQAFPIFVMSYTLAVSATYAISFLEIFYRIFTNGCGVGGDSSSSNIGHVMEDEPGSYTKMDDNKSRNTSSFWCCLRGSGSDEETAASDGSGNGSVEATAGQEMMAVADTPDIDDVHANNNNNAQQQQQQDDDEQLIIMDNSSEGIEWDSVRV